MVMNGYSARIRYLESNIWCLPVRHFHTVCLLSIKSSYVGSPRAISIDKMDQNKCKLPCIAGMWLDFSKASSLSKSVERLLWMCLCLNEMSLSGWPLLSSKLELGSLWGWWEFLGMAHVASAAIMRMWFLGKMWIINSQDRDTFLGAKPFRWAPTVEGMDSSRELQARS